MKQTNIDRSFFGPGYPGRGAYEIVFDTIKDFQHLLLALYENGTVAEITVKIDDIRKVIATMRDRSLVPALEGEIAHMEKTKAYMVLYEEELAMMGQKIDPKTGLAVSIAKSHRGRVLIAECVRAIYAARPSGVNNTHATRQKIATILKPLFVFGLEELRTDTKGLIYRAIDKENRRNL